MFVFYLGNSVALTLVILFWEFLSSVALTVIYSIPSRGEDVNHYDSLINQEVRSSSTLSV